MTSKSIEPGISTATIPATSNGQESVGRQAAAREVPPEKGRPPEADDEPLTPKAAAAVDALLAEVAPRPAIGTSPSGPTPGGRPPGTLIPTGGGPPERMLRFFRYEHLKPELQGASKPFCELARWLCSSQPASPERTKSLNALVEAKDWAVRALVPE